MEDGTEIARISLKEKMRHSQFSRDGRYLTTGGQGNVVRLWADWQTAEPRLIFELMGDSTNGGEVAFAPDSKLFATQVGTNVTLWDPVTGSAVGNFKHSADVNRTLFSPNSRYLAAGSSGGAILIWDLGRQQEAARLQHLGDVSAIIFSR